jgi:hypothetical protein
MFAVSEAEAAAIRAAFDHGGELSAAVEMRRLFPGVTDNAQARECARAIAAGEAPAGQAARQAAVPRTLRRARGNRGQLSLAVAGAAGELTGG